MEYSYGDSSGSSSSREMSLINTTFNHWKGGKTRTVTPTAQTVSVSYSTSTPVADSVVNAPMNALRMA